MVDEREANGRDDELEGTRIARIARERRAVARTRSYHIVGLIACGVWALQLLWYAFEFVVASRYVLAIGYAACAVLLLMAAIELRKRALAMAQALGRSALSEPTTPPDFSTLSDGSQQLRNLHHIKDDEEPQ